MNRQDAMSAKVKEGLIQAVFGVLGVLGVIALPGCEKDVPRTDYMPLRDGNRWEYRLLDLPLLKRLGAGQAVTTAPLNAELSAPGQGQDSDLAPKSEVVNMEPRAPSRAQGDASEAPAAPPGSASARCVSLELREAVDELTYRALYDTAEQVWSKRNGYIGFQSARGRYYLLILPPHTGYRWIVAAPGGQNLYFEIETAAATISTPAGTFSHCALARQESHDRREMFRYWFAPNVGLVRRSKYFASQEVFRQELVEYAVKPATPATRLAEDREVRKAVAGQRHGTEFQDRRRDDRARLENPEPSGYDRRVQEKVQEYGEPK